MRIRDVEDADTTVPSEKITFICRKDQFAGPHLIVRAYSELVRVSCVRNIDYAKAFSFRDISKSFIARKRHTSHAAPIGRQRFQC